MGEGFTRNRHHDIYSQIIHVFKGIRWNVLYRLNDTKGETLFYLGFPRCDYALQLSGIRFQYVLLGKNNEVLNAGNGKDDIYTYLYLAFSLNETTIISFSLSSFPYFL